MSENLNEEVHVIVEDATVITVPIDDTLSNSGEAADAKAVGDALALKADRSELQTAVTVNGQSADAQGKIIVTAADTKMSSSDNTTVKAKIEAVDGKTGADIPVDSSQGAQTIKQALASGATRTADQIEMSASDDTTVKAAIEAVAGDVEDVESAVNTLQNQTGADIPYQSGSAETIKQHVDGLTAGQVKTVNEVLPDASGNIDLERVPYADNLYTEDAEQVDESFLIRTTAGSGSLSDGSAWAQKLMGNREHAGYVAESITKTVSPMPRTAPAAITASISEATFLAKVDNTEGTYVFSHDGISWALESESVTISQYGITVTNDPIDGDEITVVVAESGGSYSATMTVDAATRTAPDPITASVDRDTWVGYVNTSGTYTFTYSTVWKLSNAEVDMTDYGITVTNTPIAGDEISIVYVKEVRGTITVAAPTKLVATGWNLYDHTHGYARCVKYSNTYGYAISGTYTSLGFAETPTGTQTVITPDSDGLFNVTGTGYIIVTGGNSTDTAIWTTWSDWTEGYDGSFAAYAESTVDITTIMNANFPYGLLRVGDTRDEIDFIHKQAISRISRTAYTEEARAAAAASGRAYEFDEDYIYQVRASEIVNSITIDEEYTVSEHGLEWFESSPIAVYSEILYGQNLRDKLKRDVVTISEQTLTNGQKGQVRTNIGAASQADLTSANEAIAKHETVYIGGFSTIASLSAELDSRLAVMDADQLLNIRLNFTADVAPFGNTVVYIGTLYKAALSTKYSHVMLYANSQPRPITGWRTEADGWTYGELALNNELLNVSKFTQTAITISTKSTLVTYLESVISTMGNNEDKLVRFLASADFDVFANGASYFCEIKRSSATYASCLIQAVGSKAVISGANNNGTWSFSLLNEGIKSSLATITIASINSGAGATGYKDIDIPSGYKVLALVPQYTSSGLLTASVYTQSGAATGKVRVTAYIYNQSSSAKTDENVTVQVLFKLDI